MQNKKILSVALVLLVAVVAMMTIQPGIFSDTVENVTTAQLSTKETPRKKEASAGDTIVIPDLSTIQREQPEAESYVQQMIQLIKREFGDSIENVAVQVGLKEFRDDLIRSYPGQGAQMFEQIIRAAFPELAEQIFALIEKMGAYEDWLLATMPELNQLDLMAQQNMLWEKRLALFGEDAKAIWQREMSPEEERNESVRQTVAMLNSADDIPMEERLYLLQNAFDENYAQSMSELVYDTSSVMTQVFFRFDSVQRELAGMAPEERQSTINDIRRKIGYSEKQIEFMTDQDQKKEARWQNGYAYMEERQALEQQALSQDEMQGQVAQLREKYFGSEAYTIGKEEDELGFFRYQRPRVYGWN